MNHNQIFGFAQLNHCHFSAPPPPVQEEAEWTSRVYTKDATEIDHRRNSSPHSFVEISRTTEDFQNVPDEEEEPCFLDNDVESLDLKDIPAAESLELSSLAATQNESCSSVKTVTTTAVTALSIVAATALSIKFGPMLSRAVHAGVTGAHEHFKKQNPANLQTYSPLEYVVPFFSAAFNTSVLDVVNQVQGHQDDRDIEEILNAVEDRISAAKSAAREFRGGWSEDQMVVAETWLDEGRKRYKDFVKKHSMGSPTNLNPKDVIS